MLTAAAGACASVARTYPRSRATLTDFGPTDTILLPMLGGSPRGPHQEVPMAERRLPIPERPWHQSKSDCWSLSLGVRGLKVRVEQRKPGGTFHRVYRVAGRRMTYASLGTTDRQEARQLAIDFIRELEQGKKVDLA